MAERSGGWDDDPPYVRCCWYASLALKAHLSLFLFLFPA